MANSRVMRRREKTKLRPRILVALDLAHDSGREQLSGVFRYAEANADWDVRLVPSSEASFVHLAGNMLASEVDGAIMKAEMASSIPDTVLDAAVPVAFIDRPESRFLADARKRVAACNDNAAIGRAAAGYFASLGRFASYACLPLGMPRAWSERRQAAFAAALRACRCKVLPPPACKDDFEYDDGALAEWLKSMPKPAAVFAVFDLLAAQVVDACRAMRIDVPGKVCVLGVDNDRIVCEHKRPQLSSIGPDHERLGFIAARELDAMLRGRRRQIGRKLVLCRPEGIVERGSTAAVPPGAILVDRARQYMEGHALKGATVADVVGYLGVSARLANLRYSQATGESIQGALVRMRLDAARRMLAETDYPFKKIAALCGFRTPAALSRLFARHDGRSMRECRRSFTAQESSAPRPKA